MKPRLHCWRDISSLPTDIPGTFACSSCNRNRQLVGGQSIPGQPSPLFDSDNITDSPRLPAANHRAPDLQGDNPVTRSSCVTDEKHHPLLGYDNTDVRTLSQFAHAQRGNQIWLARHRTMAAHNPSPRNLRRFRLTPRQNNCKLSQVICHKATSMLVASKHWASFEYEYSAAAETGDRNTNYCDQCV